MVSLEKYRQLRAIGKTPREVYLAAKKEGIGEADALCLLRDVFGLSIVEAKEAMIGGDPFDQPQAVSVGRKVYWEGVDTVDGPWIMEATVTKIDDAFAYVGEHKKFLVLPEGLTETVVTGVLPKIPLTFFKKSLQERLQESTDFWGQRATIAKAAASQ